MKSRPFSLGGELWLVVLANLVLTGGAGAAAAALHLPAWSVLLASLAVGIPAAAWSLSLAWAPVYKTLQAVTDGVRTLQENDFGVRLAVTRHDELGELVVLFNRMAEVLRLERSEIYQRELLFDALLQGAPMAILLLSERDRVVYANLAAKKFLGDGRRLQGRAFDEVLSGCDPAIRAGLASLEDGLFTVEARPGDAQGDEIFRVFRRAFQINMQQHRLVLIERMTPELNRQEVEVWKKVIRVMSHELNNSLAPVSSLIHSARTVASRPEPGPKLEEILAAAEERVRHLNTFLAGYARFARLPRPAKEAVPWAPFLEGVRRAMPFRILGELPRSPGHFDPAQLEQVLLNLLKNANEAGSPQEEIVLQVSASDDVEAALSDSTAAALPSRAFAIHVLDRGRGMDDEALEKALLPFYSSKQSGSGLGLPLCREILEAHGGRLAIQRRSGGGLAVTCLLPAPGARLH